MSAGTHINDAGTWRKLKNVYVNDSDTWRRILKAYVNDAGTWRTVFTAQDDLSITAGHSAVSGGTDGYSASAPIIGSITGATLGDGMVVTEVSTRGNGATHVLLISGFGADPGTAYLTSIDTGLNGVLLAVDASYGYSGGVATWTWSGTYTPYANGGNYSVIVIRA